MFIADYVLMGYGTGAIMAVPAHDTRDYEFATAFGLPIIEVIGSEQGVESEAFTGDGPLINSGFLDGLRVDEAKAKVVEKLEADGVATGTVQYKLRDWLFARQRYWASRSPSSTTMPARPRTARIDAAGGTSGGRGLRTGLVRSR